VKIHHILSGRVVNINSNIVRYFSSHYAAMGTRQEEHVFHLFLDRETLSDEERPFLESLPAGPDRLLFEGPGRFGVLRMLLRVGKDDVLIVHSGRMNELFPMLLVAPWLWCRTALICFGGETRIWERIARTRGWKNRLLHLVQRVVVPRLRAVCTLTPGEYAGIGSVFGRADNYRRAFMTSSGRQDDAVSAPEGRGPKRAVTVVLNQSANAGGRHREALQWLSRFRDEAIRVICPVSFGGETEAEAIIQAGQEAFGEKFLPIRAKQPYAAYSRMIREETDILVLNHLGQAGLGHLYMFLCMGKTAYIRSETPVYGFLRDLGIEIRATDALPGMSFEEFQEPIGVEAARSNIRLFNEHLSTEASVESCRGLIGYLRSHHA